MPSAKNASQTFEQLQERFEEFKEQRVVVETKKKAALEKLNELKAEALEAYGSDDLETLRAKLKKMKQDNEKKRSAYQDSLDEIEQKLDEINGPVCRTAN